MIYITKNKVRLHKTPYELNKGLHTIFLLRKAMEYDEDLKEYIKEQRKKRKEENEEERHERSLRRTRTNIQRVLEANLDDKSYFLTLTFAEDIRDYEKANQRFNYWVRQKNRNLKYLVVKELQNKNRDGVIHYHLVLFDIEDMKSIAESWTYGYYYFKPITDKKSYSIANYFTNYLTQDKNQLIANEKKIYSKSRNLNKPLILSQAVYKVIMDLNGWNIDIESFDWLQYDYITEDKGSYLLAVALK